MDKIYLGIGSNMGDKEANCRKVIELIDREDGIKVVECSSLYLTDPVGGPPQDRYLNGVVSIETFLEPGALLSVVKGIENEMGRVKAPGPDMPRVIDIDILMYGDLVIRTPALTVPHPRMHERYFVLKGLAEIAPDAVHPVLGVSVKELLEKVV